MKRNFQPWAGLLLVLWTATLGAQQNAPLATAPILNPGKQGAELAARLRAAVPEAADEFKGKLETIASDDSITTVSIVSRITPGSNQWTVSYLALDAQGRPAEELTIVHTPGSTNVYRLRTHASGAGTNAVVTSAPALNRAFAGSEFWTGDLGLDFFHWPGQSVITNEMRQSRSCWVLESTTPTAPPGGYARVRTWIDVEHNGIVRADAFGPDGKVLKEFRLGEFRKIDGRWQLESMRMRNLRTDTDSQLQFDLPRKK